MPLPRRLGRFNRRVTNPILAPLLMRLPGFGWIVVRGRRTGREHRTPMLAFRRGDHLVFALTYGAGADWVRNVCVAGGCRFVTRSGDLELTDPMLRRDRARRAVPPLVRPALAALGVDAFLHLRVSCPHRDRFVR
jgi:hypothetical protein